MTVTNAQTFTTGDAATMVIAGDFIQDGAGNSVIGDDLTSTNDGFNFLRAVTITSSDAVQITMTNGAAGDDLVFQSTLTGTDDNLAINAGANGDITFTGAVNLGTGGLTIDNAAIVEVSSTFAEIGRASCRERV